MSPFLPFICEVPEGRGSGLTHLHIRAPHTGPAVKKVLNKQVLN